jgi:hypothetical protein
MVLDLGPGSGSRGPKSNASRILDPVTLVVTYREVIDG